MKSIVKFLIFFIIVFSAFRSFSQNQTPVVQNVAFTQRTDGTFKVDIYYDVNNPEGTTMIVSMKVSDDNGQSWYFECPSATGDIGPWVSNGTNKHIEWDFAADHPNTSSDQIRIKILADDGGYPCPGMPTVTDPRNGKTYNTVQVSSQCWLRENIDIGTRLNVGQPQTDNSTIEKYCYNDDPNNCITYGGLYQWNEAMQYVTISGAKGICPNGWHIPTKEQLQILESAVGNDSQTLLALWPSDGTNTSGFSALLSITCFYNNNLAHCAEFWSSTEHDATEADYMNLSDYWSYIEFWNTDKQNGINIRCLKD